MPVFCFLCSVFNFLFSMFCFQFLFYFMLHFSFSFSFFQTRYRIRVIGESGAPNDGLDVLVIGGGVCEVEEVPVSEGHIPFPRHKVQDPESAIIYSSFSFT